MGTKERQSAQREDLQKEIKGYLKRMKWSQMRLGRELYYEQHQFESDEEELEANRFGEKAKKDLSRKTTEIEVLEVYKNLIFQHKEFAKLGLAVTSQHQSNDLSSSLNEALYGISSQLCTDISEEQ